MLSYDELERRWNDLPPALADAGTVHVIVMRGGDGSVERHTLPARVELSPETGMIGDRWLTHPERTDESHVSFIDSRVARLLTEADPARLHLPGDNFHVDLDLGEAALPVGTRLRVGTALVEITAKPHAGCQKFRARLGDDALRWVNARETRPRRLRGVYGRVVEGGSVATGDAIRIEVRPLSP